MGEPCPVRRYAHAAVCLNYGGDCPQIFIAGGHTDDTYDDQSDGWILDMQSRRWREVSSLHMGRYRGKGGQPPPPPFFFDGGRFLLPPQACQVPLIRSTHSSFYVWRSHSKLIAELDGP